MANEDFFAMLEEQSPAVEKAEEKVIVESTPRGRDTSITTAYAFLYDKPEHYASIESTYWFVIEHPPNNVNAETTAMKYLNSLTEAELDGVTSKLNMQIASPAPDRINLVSEFKKLDEMAQYKFFCGVRDLFDDEDWATLTE